MSATPPASVVVFMVLWTALAAGSAAFLRLSRNARLKRRVFPWIMVATGALFVVAIATTTGSTRRPALLLLFAVTAVAVFGLNIRTTRFCGACGRTVFNQPLLTTKASHCPYCGAKL
jgi:hypothetical protein